MIHVNSHHGEANTASRLLDMLSAHETDAEFNARKEKNRVLHLAKTVGFPHMLKSGMIQKCEPKKLRNPTKTKAQVEECYNNIKNGSTMNEEASRLGIPRSTLQSRFSHYGYKTPKNFKKPVFTAIMRHVNENGMSLRRASILMGINRDSARNIIRKNGHHYDPTTRKITKGLTRPQKSI